ncbi:MAG: CHAT domain-containing protein [Saprospiraceae bacterium]|nr:CHAT domain-containing protein [Saprospiraceae bacterium]
MRPFFFVRILLVGVFCWSAILDSIGQKLENLYSLEDTITAAALLTKADSLNKKHEFQMSLDVTQKALDIYNQLGIVGEKAALCWDNSGNSYYYLGKTDEALLSFETALDIYRNIYGKGHEKEASTLENIGTTLTMKGNFKKSLETLSEVLALKLQINDDCRTDISSTYSNLASNYYYLSNLQLAIENMEKALKVRIQCNGETDPGVATILNNLGFLCRSTGKFKKGIQYLENAAAIFTILGDYKNPDLTASYDNLGICYDEIGNYEEGLKNLEKSLELRQKYLEAEHPSIANSFGNIGDHYDRKEDYYRALYFTQKAMNIYTKAGLETDLNLAICYGNLGKIFGNLGDSYKELDCHFRSLQLRIKILGENHFDVAHAYQNIASTYYNLGEYEKAIQYHELALKIFLMSQKENHPTVATIYMNLANAYSNLGNSVKANELMEKSLNIRTQLYGNSNPMVASIYANIGNPSGCNGDLQKAIDTQKKAIEIWRENYGEFSRSLAHSYLILAENYVKAKLLIQAEEAYRLSLNALNYKGIDSLDEVNSIPQLVKSLFQFARFYKQWHFADTSPTNCLANSHRFHLLTAKVLNYKSQNLSPSSKSNLAVQMNNNFAYAMSTNYLLHTLTDSLHYLTESFSFAERSKALLLYEAMQETNALSVAGIPDTLLQQEYDLRIDIAYYDKKRQEKLSEGASDTDSTVLATGSRLFDLNRKYEALKARFEADYPQYYKAKYDLSTIPLEEVQNNLLQPNQCLLEYMVGDSNIYVFLVRKDTFYVREIKHDFPLEQWVQDMTKDGIYGYYSLPNGDTLKTAEREVTCNANYTRVAQDLYQKLVAPLADKLTEKGIVVPDGVLGYVPFEALLVQPPKSPGRFGSYNGSYLLDKHQISYCYSATLLREMRQKQHRKAPTKGVLTMAPFFQGDVQGLISRIDTTDFLALRDSLQALPASGEEAASVAKLMKGSSFYGADASLEKFREQAGGYRILHLSTHGKADDRQGDYAYLAFGRPGSFDKLYARDLYNYSLNADMVVLSACETGIGKLRKGEGIVSLARAFAYAGAKSIFTTLWQVSDEKTKDLMVYFYKNLQQGKSKDEALRLAKLDFLKRNKGQGGFDHPFFWAGMIGIGDMGAVR